MGTLTFVYLTGMLLVPGQDAADFKAINQREIQIPINFDPEQRKEIRELLLFATKSQAERWELVARETAEKDVFNFKATEDGFYWFTMMVVDKKGNRDPKDINSAPPGLKVLIDTKAPIINLKSAEKQGDDVVVTWAIQEAYPDWKTLKLEARGSDGKWYRVEAQGVATGSARIPRGVSAGISQVRMELFDVAENRGESGIKDVTEPVVPIIGKTEIPLAPLNDPMRNPIRNVSGEGPLPEIAPVPNRDEAIPPNTPQPIARTTPKNSVNRENTNTDQPKAETTPSLNPNERRLADLVPINVSRFDMSFDVESRGPSGISKAQLWVTRDDGKTWKLWTEQDRSESSIEVDLDVKGNPQLEGVYGFKVVLVSGGGLTKGQPKGGDLPDYRVDVDLTAPEIDLYPPVPDPKERDSLILRWKAHDRNMTSSPITLEWSEKKEGPWSPIATQEIRDTSYSGGPPARRLPNIGSHAWKVAPNVPARVFLKISARDTAGNVSEAITDTPVLVDLSKPEAKIQGIIGTGTKRKE
jgi:hypothetical protein